LDGDVRELEMNIGGVAAWRGTEDDVLVSEGVDGAAVTERRERVEDKSSEDSASSRLSGSMKMGASCGSFVVAVASLGFVAQLIGGGGEVGGLNGSLD
jgi:hypothetical protein